LADEVAVRFTIAGGLERFGTRHDVASDAAAWITGLVFDITGGAVMT
jgi:hypothetical protein